MGTYDRIRQAYRIREMNRILHGNRPDADRVNRAADLIIRRARKDDAAGVLKSKWLFEFESSVEEISDEIAQLNLQGEKEAYREVYRKLYEFASETMEDSYMPLYLYILYRYANAELETGDAAKAVKLFEKLCERTDRLIGIENPYGIHCLERLAVSAAKAGEPERAAKAMDEMYGIAVEQFGPCSAMALAVRRFISRTEAAR